jgi:hypothetical protein
LQHHHGTNACPCAALLLLPQLRRPLEELQRVADGKVMYSNYRMEVIDPMLGLSALDSIMQVGWDAHLRL